MDVLERLKLELNRKDYFETDDDYKILLEENGLNASNIYSKDTMYKSLLKTIVNILEIALNDIDILRRVATEFQTTDSVAKELRIRVQDLNIQIDGMKDSSTSTETTFSNHNYLFGSRW